LNIVHLHLFQNLLRFIRRKLLQALHGQDALLRQLLGEIQAVRSDADVERFERLR
jgi:hypothetical protein